MQPESAEACVLLVKIYQRQNRPIDVARVCRAAVENPAPPAAERRQFGFAR